MSTCSAPGKIILLGEHAVVFGKPALALAVDLRVTAGVTVSSSYLVNNHPMRPRYHSYLSAALDEAWDGPPLSITTRSRVPSGSGLGSSAAVTVSSVGAMLEESGQFDPEKVARRSFEVEHAVQRRASPTDTSTSAHGHGVLVSPDRQDGFLWRIEKGERAWNIHHCTVPKLTFVVGFTGIRAPTGPLVEKVRTFVEGSQEGRLAVDRIGELVLDAVDSLGSGDKRRLGTLMDECHGHLNTLGVGHERLEQLIGACRNRSYGAKMTGAGGGGSMIALTDEPESVSEAIRSVGGKPIRVEVGCEGVRVEAARDGVPG